MNRILYQKKNWTPVLNTFNRNPFVTVKSYIKIISTNSPASGTGNFSKPTLMSQVGSVREVVCA